jgi:hypothetical protein
LVLPERLLPATGRGHQMSCSFTSPPPEGASTTSDLVTVWAFSPLVVT